MLRRLRGKFRILAGILLAIAVCAGYWFFYSGDPKEVLVRFQDAVAKGNVEGIKQCFSPTKDHWPELIDAAAKMELAERRLNLIVQKKFNLTEEDRAAKMPWWDGSWIQDELITLPSATVDIRGNHAVVHLRSDTQELNRDIYVERNWYGPWKINFSDTYFTPPFTPVGMTAAMKDEAALIDKIAREITSGEIKTLDDAIQEFHAGMQAGIIEEEWGDTPSQPAVVSRPVPKVSADSPVITILR